MTRTKTLHSFAEKDAHTMARLAEQPQAITFDPKYFVRCTGLGEWSGTDFLDASTRIRGELGSPHLPYLAELSERGYAATRLARTISCLEGLEADGASFGWRIVSGRAVESERARSLFSSDINAVADVVGKESSIGHSFKIQLCGPLTLASSLYLPNGERAISDRGATRDIRDSLIAGISSWIELIQEAVPGEQLFCQFSEPLAAAALQGELLTASKFRTLAPVEPHVLEESFEMLQSELSALNVKIAISDLAREYHPKISASADALAINTAEFADHDWEDVARVVESGTEAWLGSADPQRYVPVADAAQKLWRAWRNVGLPASSLASLNLTESSSLQRVSSGYATQFLAYLTDMSRAISEIAQDS
ncbi:MAG: hypothetical protein Q3974_06245 [Rothia sp. (in: high G+C Gram-positive bacteria)]|nr:hypothetical protein [Rothia sp. (in: high G+C Gram-positive bacteria)]